MKTYQQPNLSLRRLQEQDVIRTSTFTGATTQSDFFNLEVFENEKESNG
ncbi:MAG: hypothetical protein IJ514_07835 [Clostridia bacterium]|nr:hypothetical protein [Clostridia bacterium]